MERVIKCFICGLKLADNLCSRCGKSVCSLDFNSKMGCCKFCARGLEE